MFVLLDFTPIKPDFGLFFWTTIIFLLFWFLMAKFAFIPIKNALKKREKDIQHALDEAKLAKESMANMKAENEKLLALAREERSKILQEAKEMKNAMISEAKSKAKEEATKIVTSAKQDIDNQKKAAIAEVKNELGNMALTIAEKVIRKELKGNQDQEQFVSSIVKDMNLN